MRISVLSEATEQLISLWVVRLFEDSNLRALLVTSMSKDIQLARCVCGFWKVVKSDPLLWRELSKGTAQVCGAKELYSIFFVMIVSVLFHCIVFFFWLINILYSIRPCNYASINKGTELKLVYRAIGLAWLSIETHKPVCLSLKAPLSFSEQVHTFRVFRATVSSLSPFCDCHSPSFSFCFLNSSSPPTFCYHQVSPQNSFPSSLLMYICLQTNKNGIIYTH